MELIHFSAGTSTVEQAMQQLKIARSDIVKSILLFAGKIPVLCILQGNLSIDFQKIRALTNETNVRMATPEEVLLHTGYPVGAVTPLSSLPLVFLDAPVAERGTVYAGGGTKESLMFVSIKEILASSHPKICPISRPQ
jgi:prolyl-tRNA editing enzyme YbaK/EbsC (Cys-tRNA(Pro) deacylase)